MKSLADGRVALYAGDCLAALARLEANSVDSVVTDPPYHLQADGRSTKRASPDAAQRARIGGFMGMKWDGGDIAFRPEVWREALRVLKPGGHLVAFAATRTYHRIAVAIEDAGFEIRDQLAWVYGQGFPKSHDVSKAIDKAAGAVRETVGVTRSGIGRASRGGNDLVGSEHFEELKHIPLTSAATESARAWEGWGTALKPAWEPIVLARKPLSERSVAANVLRWGTGAINVDACRVSGETPSVERRAAAALSGKYGRLGDKTNGDQGKLRANGNREEGLANYLNGKEGDALGRWPANIVHDGSDEVVEAFPERDGCSSQTPSKQKTRNVYGEFREDVVNPAHLRGDSGSAARFFYCAKASRAERRGSKHPTVKPVNLMRWLVRLITPPGGLVLDPFAGTGTTAEAALAEGFRAILIEREAEYRVDIARRLKSRAPSAERRAPSAERRAPSAEPTATSRSIGANHRPDRPQMLTA